MANPARGRDQDFSWRIWTQRAVASGAPRRPRSLHRRSRSEDCGQFSRRCVRQDGRGRHRCTGKFRL